MRQNPPADTTAPLAGFGRRAVAMLVDAAILFVAYILAAALLLSLGTPDSLVAAVVYLVALTYYPIGWSKVSEGQSLGMRGLDIEVVGRGGEFISVWRAIGRYLAATLSAIPLGLGFWWAIWDPQNQTWHDKIAGTWVRRVDYRPRPTTMSSTPSAERHPCPRCGESIAASARVCRFCGLELGERWAS